MRCVIAMMQHETNTFSSVVSAVGDFASGVGLAKPPRGAAAVDIYGAADFAFAGLLQVAQQRGAEVVVPIAAYGEPGGIVTDQAFEMFADAICEEVTRGCDAVLLDLHGAMVTRSHTDGEGELLKRLRRIAPATPIAVALDFHANLSADMVANCTVIDGYRTYPHIDMHATGRRAATTLFHLMEHGLDSKMCWRALPMVTHMLKQTPLRQPMKDIMELAISYVGGGGGDRAGDDADGGVDSSFDGGADGDGVANNGKVLNASVFGGFPHADIPHVSVSALTVETLDGRCGERLVNRLCDMAWRRRADFVFAAEPMEKSIATAKALTDYPVVIADHGDNSGGGGSGDDLSVLAEMLKQDLTDIVAGPICDPQAVAHMLAAGEGAAVRVRVGGKIHAPAIGHIGRELELVGVVGKITDGRFTIAGPMQTGLTVNLGRTAVLECDGLVDGLAAKSAESDEAAEATEATAEATTKSGKNPPRLQLVVSEHRWEPYDIGCFTHAGLEPRNKRYIMLKARQHFRAVFETFAKHIVLAAGPGVCSSDYAQYPYQNLQRRVYPLDLATPNPRAECSVYVWRRR